MSQLTSKVVVQGFLEASYIPANFCWDAKHYIHKALSLKSTKIGKRITRLILRITIIILRMSIIILRTSKKILRITTIFLGITMRIIRIIKSFYNLLQYPTSLHRIARFTVIILPNLEDGRHTLKRPLFGDRHSIMYVFASDLKKLRPTEQDNGASFVTLFAKSPCLSHYDE